jgi:hypothetical protein
MGIGWIYVGVAYLVLVGFAWRSRARAASRWLTALDRYAEREINEERRRKSSKKEEVASVA